MKIFDATAIIAFLSEMECPEGLELLSEHYKLIIPQGVADEITKEPGKTRLAKLKEKKVVSVVRVDEDLATKIQKSHPQLHSGECEAIAYALSTDHNNCIVSDDGKARNFFQKLNFKWTEKLLEIMKEKAIIDDATFNSKKEKLEKSSFYSRR